MSHKRKAAWHSSYISYMVIQACSEAESLADAILDYSFIVSVVF